MFALWVWLLVYLVVFGCLQVCLFGVSVSSVCAYVYLSTRLNAFACSLDLLCVYLSVCVPCAVCLCVVRVLNLCCVFNVLVCMYVFVWLRVCVFD